MRLKIRTQEMQDGTLRIEASREIVPRFRGSFQRNIVPSRKDLIGVGELGAMIIDNFFICEGVVQVKVHSPYGFIIEKGLAFSWESMLPELRSALRYCLHYGPPHLREWAPHAKTTTGPPKAYIETSKKQPKRP